MGIAPGISPITFRSKVIPTANSPQMLIDYAEDGSRGDLMKLIFHFKNVSIKDMNAIGKILWELVNSMNIPTAVASASPSPVYRNQWDFIFMDVPTLRAPLIQADILQAVAKNLGV
jgi:hypothetical protein